MRGQDAPLECNLLISADTNEQMKDAERLIYCYSNSSPTLSFLDGYYSLSLCTILFTIQITILFKKYYLTFSLFHIMEPRKKKKSKIIYKFPAAETSLKKSLICLE